MNALQRLGYPPDTKLLLLHADDAGLCHAENQATMLALQQGMLNSYSIMPACPWFLEMAQFALHNSQFDYGIHLTLSCEWQHYKWGPLLGPAEVPSLLRPDGYFHSNKADFKNKAHPDEIRKELRAQIERAYQFGLRPSHLDVHMFVLGQKPEFFAVYKELGAEYGLPLLLNEAVVDLSTAGPEQYFSDSDFRVDRVLLGNYPVFAEGGLFDLYLSLLDTLEPGLNVLIVHPAFDNAEMQGVAVEHPNFGSAWRQIDFDFCTDPRCAAKIAEQGIQRIDWREISRRLGAAT